MEVSFKVTVIGGGPAGLYFALLLKKNVPSANVDVYERNGPDDTFGFGVVFSDATLGNLKQADEKSYSAITSNFAHWDSIETYLSSAISGDPERAETKESSAEKCLLTSSGHGFCGLARKKLLQILQVRCKEVGVNLHFNTGVDDYDGLLGDADLVVAADGVGSGCRSHWAPHFQPEVDLRPNRFVWLGTDVPFEAFTFYFKEAAAGLFRVHAYRYAPSGSTFIVECTEETFQKTGLAEESETETMAYLEKVFADELKGHRLVPNRSIWRKFPTVHNKNWHFQNAVLLGDAAHTAHFSIGSGTKLAMEDSILLSEQIEKLLSRELDGASGQTAVSSTNVSSALAAYQAARRPVVERTQRAAQISLEWFEGTERYMSLPPLMFEFSLMTRSLRLGYARLHERDPKAAERVRRFFAGDKQPWQAPFDTSQWTVKNRIAVFEAKAGETASAMPDWVQEPKEPGIRISQHSKPPNADCFWIQTVSVAGKIGELSGADSASKGFPMPCSWSQGLKGQKEMTYPLSALKNWFRRRKKRPIYISAFDWKPMKRTWSPW